jgi:hypothetical protein
MKRFFVVPIVLGLMAINLSAQDGAYVDLRENATIGFKIGANYSNVYDAQDESFIADPKFGLATGIFASIPIGRFLGIQPEILFSQRGFKSTGSVLGYDYELKRTSNYIDIPLLFAIKPASSFTVLAGPQFSFLIKQKDELEGANANVVREFDIDNDNLRKSTLCLTGGFDLNINHMVFGARAGWDIRENKGDGETTTPRYKNMWYQATIGFRF